MSQESAAQQLVQVDFYTDGACPGNGQSPQGGSMGAGIVAKSGEIQREWAVPLGRGTNQKAELLAIKEALLRVKNRPKVAVRIHTDSAYAIGCITKPWKVKANVELVDEIKLLVRECGRFEMRKVAGHSGVPQNERADELAVRAAVTGESYSGTV